MDVSNSLEHFSLWAFFLNDWNWTYILLFGGISGAFTIGNKK